MTTGNVAGSRSGRRVKTRTPRRPRAVTAPRISRRIEPAPGPRPGTRARTGPLGRVPRRAVPRAHREVTGHRRSRRCDPGRRRRLAVSRVPRTRDLLRRDRRRAVPVAQAVLVRPEDLLARALPVVRASVPRLRPVACAGRCRQVFPGPVGSLPSAAVRRCRRPVPAASVVPAAHRAPARRWARSPATRPRNGATRPTS